MPTRVVLTYRDYEALPADGRRYELHEGELSVTPAPGTQHQWLVGELFALLREHVRTRGLGQVFVVTPPSFSRTSSTSNPLGCGS